MSHYLSPLIKAPWYICYNRYLTFSQVFLADLVSQEILFLLKEIQAIVGHMAHLGLLVPLGDQEIKVFQETQEEKAREVWLDIISLHGDQITECIYPNFICLFVYECICLFKITDWC